MYNLLNVYDCHKCGKRLSDEVEYISVQVGDDELEKMPFCNSCNSEVTMRVSYDIKTKQEMPHYEEVDDERARWANGFYDENDEADDEDEYWTCSTCGGEFWPGGTSCSCEYWYEEPSVQKQKFDAGIDDLPF